GADLGRTQRDDEEYRGLAAKPGEDLFRRGRDGDGQQYRQYADGAGERPERGDRQAEPARRYRILGVLSDRRTAAALMRAWHAPHPPFGHLLPVLTGRRDKWQIPN